MNDDDFGTVYGHLRPFWYNDLTEDKLQSRETWDRQMRRDVLVNNRIISPLIPPRRVWDLYSNRVVPWWVARQYPWAISHAWMKEEDRVDMCTPINGCGWPVPMPRDADLDLIRIEMLNNGAEYVWLDVLCLRQVCEWREERQERHAGRRVERHARLHDRRAERLDRLLQRLGERVEDRRAEREDRCTEWKVDVPTIGRVYQMARENQLVCYLSGLGRPFSLKKNDLQSDRCWFRRAWTLQEVNKAVIIGGDTGDDRFTEKGMRTWVDKELSSLEESISPGDNDVMGMPVFTALSEMRKRASMNPVDKVAGLAYLLRTDEISQYSETQSEEDAWTALVDELNMTYRGHLFFLYPKRGNGKMFWRPSWNQAMTGTLPPPHLSDHDSGWLGFVRCSKERGVDWCHGPCIDSGLVRGLSRRSLEDFRWGELIVEDDTGVMHVFKIVADHEYSIPEGSYALVGSDPYFEGTLQKRQFWVIGDRFPGRKFRKVSVFQIPNKEDVERLHELGVTTNTKTVLV